MFASTTIVVAWVRARWKCTEGRSISLILWAGEEFPEVNVLKSRHFSIVLLMVIVAGNDYG